LSISSSTTVVPGAGDRRELGVQVDRLVCRPEAAGLVLPPRRAIGAAALALHEYLRPMHPNTVERRERASPQLLMR